MSSLAARESHRRQNPAAAILGPFTIEAPGYGDARRIIKWERHGEDLLPLVMFSGGRVAALYYVPADGGAWRRVYR